MNPHAEQRRPEVSVIIPAYNVARYIACAVNSALNQESVELEVIVVDDGSTDRTVAESEEIKDSRLRIVRQENGGGAKARNTGIERATAPYIAFLDGDDFWDHSKLATHITFLNEHPEVDLTFSYSCVVDERGRQLGRLSRAVKGKVSFRSLLIENVISNGSAVVMRREALRSAGVFDAELTTAEDHDLWLRVSLLRPGNTYCIPHALTYYRMRDGQLTKDWRSMEQGWLKVMAKMRRLAPHDVAAVERKAGSRYYRYLGYIAYENRQFSESRSLLFRALTIDFAELLADRRFWILTGALAIQSLLPAKLYLRLESFARSYRARRALPGRA
jgi:glycosyltransferase involved in cell wall biosynthesis